MAAGFLRAVAGELIDVFSGGSEPAPTINPVAIEAMAEKGIDISEATPRAWTDAMLGEADIIVTMGCGDSCPIILGKRYLDWDLVDPSGKPIEEVREIRDEIERRVRRLVAGLDVDVDRLISVRPWRALPAARSTSAAVL